MADPDIITLEDAILTVQGIVAWLRHTRPALQLAYDEGEVRVIAVPDARRAGLVLEALVHTSGMA